jgi:hypothetical protein
MFFSSLTLYEDTIKNPRKYDFVYGIYIILLQAKILVKFCLVIPQLMGEKYYEEK